MDAAFRADPYSGLLMAEWIVAAQEEIAPRLKTAEATFWRGSAGLCLQTVVGRNRRQSSRLPSRSCNVTMPTTEPRWTTGMRWTS